MNIYADFLKKWCDTMKAILKFVIMELVFCLFAFMATIVSIAKYVCWRVCVTLAKVYEACDRSITWLAAKGAIIGNAIKEW